MLISQASEDVLISGFAPYLPKSSAVVPSGDDSAVLETRGNVAVSVDMLVENRHFKREWSTGYDVGYRAAQQNLADAVAVGAMPVSLVVGMALPGDLEVEWLNDFARGLAAACEPHGVGVDGGDLVAGSEIAISVTVLGDMEGREPLLRSGALPGHKVVHCGNLGHGIAGFELLSAGFSESDENPKVGALVGNFLRPQPPINEAMEAVRGGSLRSLMDVSDGLVRDTRRIAKASRVWIDLDQKAIEKKMGPLATAAGRLGADRRTWLFTGGEDHGFVGTIPADGEVPDAFAVIGEVLAPDQHGRITISGKDVNQSTLGWDHFSQ